MTKVISAIAMYACATRIFVYSQPIYFLHGIGSVLLSNSYALKQTLTPSSDNDADSVIGD